MYKKVQPHISKNRTEVKKKKKRKVEKSNTELDYLAVTV